MAINGHESNRRGNLVLNGLPAEDRERLLGHLTRVTLRNRQVLFEPRETIRHVYFPIGGVVSLVTPLQDGSIVEVATIGNEGIVGVPLEPGGALAVRAIAQVSGPAMRMPAAVFLDEFGGNAPLRPYVQSYTMALFGQISQAAACNRLHSNEERLSRWLLMSHDRVGRDEFSITHEFLGQMLGSRRATVTLSASILQAAGLIRYKRGRMIILDRPGLEAVACECYAVIRNLLEPDGAAGQGASASPKRPVRRHRSR